MASRKKNQLSFQGAKTISQQNERKDDNVNHTSAIKTVSKFRKKSQKEIVYITKTTPNSLKPTNIEYSSMKRRVDSEQTVNAQSQRHYGLGDAITVPKCTVCIMHPK